MQIPEPVVRWQSMTIVAITCLFWFACNLQEGSPDGDTTLDPVDALLISGCADLYQNHTETTYADQVVSVAGLGPSELHLAERAVNGVRGAGPHTGGSDVFSMGYSEDDHNSLVLRWSGRRVCNGPGIDFVVFENAFVLRDGESHFMDHLIVQLSRDGENWVSMPHDYLAPDQEVYSPLPTHWFGFAGVQPVMLHEEENPVDPFDATLAGGDAFDLDWLPRDGGEGDAIRAEGFVFLRLITAPSVVNPDTGQPYVRDPIANGADVDGVYGRYLRAE